MRQVFSDLPSGCATLDSEQPIHTICPPVLDDSWEFQTRGAEEMDILPEQSAILEMLSDCGAMRNQALTRNMLRP